MDRKGILAGGNFIMDFTRIIDAYPGEETLASIIRTTTGNGGAAYNVLKDLSMMKAGFPLHGIGLVGNDEPGKIILNDCKKAGIDIGGIKSTDSAGTSFTEVMLSKKTGKRTFFHYRGANAFLDIEHFNLDQFNAKIFHLGYLTLLDELDIITDNKRTRASVLLEMAKNHNFIVSTDLVSVNNPGYSGIVKPSLPFIDYLFMNEIETEKLTGIPIMDNNRVEINKVRSAAEQVLQYGTKTVVIHFPEGASVFSDNLEEFHGSVLIPSGKIAGTTGAGDAFASGFLYGIHNDFSIRDCLKTGICIAASCLLHETCSGGILPLKQSLELGSRYGFRDIR